MAATNMDEIAELFKKLRFRKRLFGGVSEKDVWKKLEQIQNEYRSAYEAQAQRYEGRLQERDEQIVALKGKIPGGESP